MGEVINFKKKESDKKKYAKAVYSQVSYSDVVYTDFHDSVVSHINRIILIHKETEGDRDYCRMNLVAILSKILGEFVAAIHTKNVGNRYSLESIQDFLEGRYEQGVVNFLTEDEQSMFILEDL